MRKKEIVLMICLGLAFLSSGCGANVINKGAESTDPKGPYYAVALTTGSLFFAHLKGQDERYVYLTNIYYFQRTPPPPSKDKGNPEQPGLTLVRQVNDLHGPKDEMVLNRQQLLYYQELRDDSAVTQRIRQAEQAAQNAPAQQPAAATPPQSVSAPAKK